MIGKSWDGERLVARRSTNDGHSQGMRCRGSSEGVRVGNPCKTFSVSATPIFKSHLPFPHMTSASLILCYSFSSPTFLDRRVLSACSLFSFCAVALLCPLTFLFSSSFKIAKLFLRAFKCFSFVCFSLFSYRSSYFSFPCKK